MNINLAKILRYFGGASVLSLLLFSTDWFSTLSVDKGTRLAGEEPVRSVSNSEERSRDAREENRKFDFYKFLGVEASKGLTVEHVRALRRKVAECNSASELDQLIRVIPPEFCAHTQGRDLFQFIWRRYPAEDAAAKFRHLSDLGLELDEQGKGHLAHEIFYLIGSKAGEAGYPEPDFARLNVLSQKSADEFSAGFTRTVSSANGSDNALAFVEKMLAEEGEKFEDFAMPYCYLVRQRQGIDEAVEAAVGRFQERPKAQRAAYEAIIRFGSLSPENVASLVNVMDWNDREMEGRYLRRLTSRAIASPSVPPNEGFRFLSGFSNVDDQVLAGQSLGIVYGKRFGDDLYGMIPLDLDPKVRKAIVDSYEVIRQAQ